MQLLLFFCAKEKLFVFLANEFCYIYFRRKLKEFSIK